MDKKQQELFDSYLDLFDKRAFAHIATLMPDGSPQVSPVWVEYDGNFVLVNTAVGRQKDLNVRRDPRVALAIQDPDNPYRKLLLRGKVVEIIGEGAEQHIDELAVKYTGEKYAWRTEGMRREILKIKIDRAAG